VMRILTRREYAALKFRTYSTVCLWIETGRISPDAVVPLPPNRGRKCTGIWVERADADLAERLDPGQQRAQAYPIRVRQQESSDWRNRR
jgi:hypothetical protein